jgi:hypothetical protein
MSTKRKIFMFTLGLVFLLVFLFAGARLLSRPLPGELRDASEARGKGADTFLEEKEAGAPAEGKKKGAAPFSYGSYDRILKAYVDDRGMVYYRGLKAQPKDLDAFVAAAGRLDPHGFAKWPESEKIAFWINAYNALTLQVIIRNYPIRSSFFRSLIYPKNSIRQIPGVWDKIRFQVVGRRMTLNDIEHGILRKKFDEPRIHFALVCASIGCPKLRSDAYQGARLSRQLDDQTRQFLRNAEKFRIDRHDGRVYLSPIFKWFGGDFVKTYATEKGFGGHDGTDRAVLNFISRYLADVDRAYLVSGEYDTEYLDYDWSLNEQHSIAGRHKIGQRWDKGEPGEHEKR